MGTCHLGSARESGKPLWTSVVLVVGRNQAALIQVHSIGVSSPYILDDIIFLSFYAYQISVR